jgi:hypothetical protein
MVIFRTIVLCQISTCVVWPVNFFGRKIGRLINLVLEQKYWNDPRPVRSLSWNQLRRAASGASVELGQVARLRKKNSPRVWHACTHTYGRTFPSVQKKKTYGQKECPHYTLLDLHASNKFSLLPWSRNDDQIKSSSPRKTLSAVCFTTSGGHVWTVYSSVVEGLYMTYVRRAVK